MRWALIVWLFTACHEPSSDGPMDWALPADAASRCGDLPECRVPRDCGDGILCEHQDSGAYGCCREVVCTSDDDCAPLNRPPGAAWVCDESTSSCHRELVAMECTVNEPETCPAGLQCLSGV